MSTNGFNEDDHPRSGDGRFTDKPVDEASGGMSALPAQTPECQCMAEPNPYDPDGPEIVLTHSSGCPLHPDCDADGGGFDEAVECPWCEAYNCPAINTGDPAHCQLNEHLGYHGNDEDGGREAALWAEEDAMRAESGSDGLLSRLMNLEPPSDDERAEAQTPLDAAAAAHDAALERPSVEIVKTDPSRAQVEAMLAAGVSKDLKVWETCGKCQGTGSVSWGVDVDAVVGGRVVPKVCFDCNGAAGKSSTLGAINRRWKDRDRRDAKRAAEAEKKAAERRAEEAAKAAERDAKRAEFIKAHPDVIAALPDTPGEFGVSMRAALDEYGALTEKQAAAVLRIAAERANQPDAAPVVEGRGEVAGTVVSTKWVHDLRGNSVMKMVVLDDRGFKVYGTVPDSLRSSNYYDETGAYQHKRGIQKGDRVTFIATNSKSDNDETFGYFKRPAKATFEPAPEPGPDLDKGRELAELAGATSGSADDRYQAVLAAHGAGKIAQEDLEAVDAWIKQDTDPKNFSTERLVQHYGLTEWGDEARTRLTQAQETDGLSDAQLLAAAKHLRGEV